MTRYAFVFIGLLTLRSTPVRSIARQIDTPLLPPPRQSRRGVHGLKETDSTLRTLRTGTNRLAASYADPDRPGQQPALRGTSLANIDRVAQI